MPTPADAAGFQAAATAPAAATGRHQSSWVDGVFYPSSDGRPMAENMWQGEAVRTAAGDLTVALPDALVAEDILVYAERGNTKKSRAPDVLVALGLGTYKRMSYFVWKEGKPPDWVLEVASQSTKAKDLGEKRRDYLEMGVPEYWLFDPRGDHFPPGMPRLQGLTLVDGSYLPIPTRVEQGMAVVRSEVLGLDIRRDGELLRFRNPATGQDIRHQAEAESDAVREAALRKALEVRVAELEVALERGRDKS